MTALRISAIVAAGLLATGVGTMPAAAMSARAFMKAVNTNADTTISKKEIDTYAKARFAALESDKDKTLDAKELRGRLSSAGMTIADADKDKTIDEAEFVGYADKLFDMANTNGDKTLSVEELETSAGRKLIKLLE